MNPRFQMTALLASMFVVGFVLWTVLSGAGGEGVAFADVQQAMNQVRTLTYWYTRTVNGKDPVVLKVMHREPSRRRTEVKIGASAADAEPSKWSPDQISIVDYQAGRVLTLFPQGRTARLRPIDRTEEQKHKQAEGLARLRDIPSKAARKLGEKEFGGRKVLEFVVRSNGRDENVLVDKTTTLPIRSERTYKDEEGNTIHEVVWDYTFDAPLDESLFRLTPPEGYSLVDQVGPTVPAPSGRAESGELIVSPDAGIGGAKFGMKKEEIIRVLGQPDVIRPSTEWLVLGPEDATTPSGEIRLKHKGIPVETLVYASRGFDVIVSPQDGMISLECYGQSERGELVHDFRGKTKEGVQLGVTPDEVRRLYGEPSQPNQIVKLPQASGASVEVTLAAYPERGYTFKFTKGRLCSISVRRSATAEQR